MSQDLVEDPVEDVEEEEGQREAGPRHRVDLLGSINEQLPHLLRAFPAAASRCMLGSVGRGCWGVRRRHRVVGAHFGLFDAAGSGGDGCWGGQPALMDIHFLLEEEEEEEDEEEVKRLLPVSKHKLKKSWIKCFIFCKTTRTDQEDVMSLSGCGHRAGAVKVWVWP